MNKTESIKYYDLDEIQVEFVDMLNELEDRLLDYKKSSEFNIAKYKKRTKVFTNLQKFFQHHRIKGV